jgi:hypothetical protein
MRHEDIPPANEYERGVIVNRRKPCPPQIESKVGGLALVPPLVRRLLDLSIPFTRLKIGSPDDAILLNLQCMPGRVNVYPMALTDERKEKMEEFCARKGLEPFTEYLGFQPWSAEPIIGYVFKGDSERVAALVTELLRSVYDAKADEKFHFALM